ncbi:hypothetical protein [Halomonas urumqiensis]|uniref:DUF2513 domain-containing protein n=1 Tax=Halomonas urumqiensis TaxID=1684789 RepID=A0A2N7UMP1_9GAMM|nr:hypothetical protein [Halomonas urumqiensis]PMR81672.1 hypothetical protein C1H70_04555 [Halomonas urumqiensis]PTB02309.1 hypothetical protein C6V82_11535 [Halomonas urumqiensis]GHE21779.1 hypothetical protein GCM10017767_23000 [Halomonas urumqiensis]
MEKFNRLVALLFGTLYEEFPVPHRLDAARFLEKVIDERDEEGAFNFSEYFESTVKWLETAGYVWVVNDYTTLDGYDIEVVLSEKGLEALRQVPSSLEGSESLGERFASFAKSRTSEALSTLISIAIGSTITGATSS